MASGGPHAAVEAWLAGRADDAALERAKAIGEPEAIARVLTNFVEAARDFRRYDLVDRYVDETVAFLAEHEFDLYRDLLSSRLAALALERGRWQVAEEQALALLAETVRSNQVRVRALEVMGRLRARRGEPGAWAALDEAMAIVLHSEGVSAVTRRLEVELLAPAPVGTFLRVDAAIERREGGRLWLTASARTVGEQTHTVATARGEFRELPLT
jgi:hypothetical protein